MKVAYQQDLSILNRLAQQALAQKEIQEGMEKAHLSAERVTSILDAQAERLWSAATDQIKDYDAIEQRLY
ncbi:MAG: hypothetical protein ACJ74G_07285, partial [Blastocatellia bacterium]